VPRAHWDLTSLKSCEFCLENSFLKLQHKSYYGKDLIQYLKRPVLLIQICQELYRNVKKMYVSWICLWRRDFLKMFSSQLLDFRKYSVSLKEFFCFVLRKKITRLLGMERCQR
jgi:hypothetical protein